MELEKDSEKKKAERWEEKQTNSHRAYLRGTWDLKFFSHNIGPNVSWCLQGWPRRPPLAWERPFQQALEKEWIGEEEKRRRGKPPNSLVFLWFFRLLHALPKPPAEHRSSPANSQPGFKFSFNSLQHSDLISPPLVWKNKLSNKKIVLSPASSRLSSAINFSLKFFFFLLTSTGLKGFFLSRFIILTSQTNNVFKT